CEESRSSYGWDTSEEAALRDYLQPGILILDDLGAGSLSDHERRYTLEVLDRRINHLRPTVVTSNLSLKQISEHMDERIGSRLWSFQLIPFEGPDKRGEVSK